MRHDPEPRLSSLPRGSTRPDDTGPAAPRRYRWQVRIGDATAGIVLAADSADALRRIGQLMPTEQLHLLYQERIAVRRVPRTRVLSCAPDA